eukprot:CAMPEP_0170593210 /NCGR_PEP_ID=MMETSP0224-20130122/13326_1 /TAXON_ID=285029 /ORGANISM="Togula jolla, Strain CCCM 725" /LENGTH=139 /DNA_ID=CAMNT_0010917147 /DNA_START=35 /DNA_END=454 /DNA_ORIENTATION=-
MAPRAKPKAKAKAKAKATGKATGKPQKETSSKAVHLPLVEGGVLDIGSVEKVLERWSAAKQRQDEASKEVEACKTQIDAAMIKTGQTALKTSRFEVSKRTQSRESVSKKDMPANVWSLYAKTSEFTVLSFKDKAKPTRK